MADYDTLAAAYVNVWHETDAKKRRRMIESLWTDDGIECTKTTETKGYEALEARITASHEKNIRDAGRRFRLVRCSVNHGVVKLDWEMFRQADNALEASGCYVLLLNENNKIRAAYIFSN